MEGRFGDGEGKEDGGSGSEGAYQGDQGIGKCALTRRKFIKTSAAVSAAVVGIPPYNLTDIPEIFLNEDGELIMYPVIDEFKFESAETYI
jgi:hypothetical protein